MKNDKKKKKKEKYTKCNEMKKLNPTEMNHRVKQVGCKAILCSTLIFAKLFQAYNYGAECQMLVERPSPGG